MVFAGGCSILHLKKHSGDSILSDLGFRMVPIHGGSFQMGDIGDGGLDREEPVHTVTLDGFEMCATEVTVGQFRTFVEETGYKTEAERGDYAYVVSEGGVVRKPVANWMNPYLKQSDNHPVVCVSWNDAVAFCEWLSKKTGQKITLPTDEEGVCMQGGAETRYYTGNDESDLDRAGWYWRNSGKSHLSGDWQLIKLNENNCGTHPVGMKAPNAWGLYDMTGKCGNVSGPDRQRLLYVETFREPGMFRGGAWYEQAVYLRTAYRHWRRPSHSVLGPGFPDSPQAMNGFAMKSRAEILPVEKEMRHAGEHHHIETRVH